MYIERVKKKVSAKTHIQVLMRHSYRNWGRAFVVMLAYLIRRELQCACAHLNLTVEEGLKNLNTLCVMKLHITEDAKIQKIPTPRPKSLTLLKALGVTLPSYIPTAELRVATKTKAAPKPQNPVKHSPISTPKAWGFRGNFRSQQHQTAASQFTHKKRHMVH